MSHKEHSRYAFFPALALLALLALILPVATVADSSQEQTPEATIQAISDQLAHIWSLEQDQIKSDPTYVHRLANEIIVPHVDFFQVSRLALGKYWRRATAEQKEQFAEQFRRLLVRTYASAFHELGEWEIKFLPRRESSDDTNVMVYTEVNRPGAPPVSVNYRMRRNGDRWQAYDVVIEGVSLVTNYRSSFARELRKGGMAGLIESVTRLNDQRSAQTAPESSPEKAG